MPLPIPRITSIQSLAHIEDLVPLSQLRTTLRAISVSECLVFLTELSADTCVAAQPLSLLDIILFPPCTLPNKEYSLINLHTDICFQRNPTCINSLLPSWFYSYWLWWISGMFVLLSVTSRPVLSRWEESLLWFYFHIPKCSLFNLVLH